MITLILSTLFVYGALSVDIRAPPHYIQRGCTPVVPAGGSEITSYDCSAVEQRSTELCYNDGVGFAPGTVIDYPYDNLTNHYVGLGRLTVYDTCTCKPKTGDAVYEMAHFECALPEPKSGQRGNKEPQADCEIDEVKYADGQIMYGYSESKCDRCVCRKGKPICKPLSCGFDLFDWMQLARGCVPAYDDDVCCDRLFMRCPREDDVVVPAQSGEPSDLKCHFGKLTLNIGDSIPLDPETCNDCSCVVPPMLTCTGHKGCAPTRVV